MFLTLLIVATASAETPNFPSPEVQRAWETQNPGSLPHWLTPDELQRLDEIGHGFEPTAPPVGPVRQPAEFEPMQGVLIRYPFGLSYPVIAEMSMDVELVTIVANTSQQNYVDQQYQSHGVNMSNCSYLLAPSDSYWVRDYGPWFIIDDAEQAIVDQVYNRPRPNDDDIPAEYGLANSIPVFAMDLIATGGNYMTDGHGISVSTDLVWTENPSLTHTQIDQLVQDYLGINTYHVVPDVLDEYIEHIDCWAKFLAPDKIMIIEVPAGDSQYGEIENAVDYFENQTSCYGTPYNVVRVYTPNGQPYVNSLILNNKVLVPITGSSWDDDAIASYEAAMPGYEVLGFTGSWVTTDALHCRAMGITDQYMLYINHTPLRNSRPTDDGFLVEAEVIPYSGTALINGTPVVYWTADSTLNTVAMNYVGAYNYEAYIPPQSRGTTIRYFIHAEDESGRSENHPYIGAPGAHSFTALDQIVSSLAASPETIDGGSYVLSLNAGPENALRDYILMARQSGANLGSSIHDYQSVPPTSHDWRADALGADTNTRIIQRFKGRLDDDGRATVTVDLKKLHANTANRTVCFAFVLSHPLDFVSETTSIRIRE